MYSSAIVNAVGFLFLRLCACLFVYCVLGFFHSFLRGENNVFSIGWVFVWTVFHLLFSLLFFLNVDLAFNAFWSLVLRCFDAPKLCHSPQKKSKSLLFKKIKKEGTKNQTTKWTFQ